MKTNPRVFITDDLTRQHMCLRGKEKREQLVQFSIHSLAVPVRDYVNELK